MELPSTQVAEKTRCSWNRYCMYTKFTYFQHKLRFSNALNGIYMFSIPQCEGNVKMIYFIWSKNSWKDEKFHLLSIPTGFSCSWAVLESGGMVAWFTDMILSIHITCISFAEFMVTGDYFWNIVPWCMVSGGFTSRSDSISCTIQTYWRTFQILGSSIKQFMHWNSDLLVLHSRYGWM